MEKIAVIADLHGNIPALEAVLADITKRSVREIIVLGDLVGKGPHSDKAVDMIQELNATVIKGNWDDGLNREGHGKDFNWYKEQLGSKRLKYLDNLPVYCQFYLSGRFIRLFHSSADSLYHRVYPWSPEEERLGMFLNHDFVGGKDQPLPDVIGYADIHHTYILNFQEKILFNTGSVGNPLDIPEASYVILEGEYGAKLKGSFSINFVRVPYDITRAIREAEESNMPFLEEFVNELKTARYRGRKD